MSLSEIGSGALECLPLKRTRFLIFAKLEKDGGQIALRRKGVGMIRPGVPNAAFQHFTKHHSGLFQMTLLEQDRPDSAECIHSHRMFKSEGGSEMIQGSVQ